jgi:N-acetylglucosaminyl-diphospho-decaprenol L-rhamnosyltransferase
MTGTAPVTVIIVAYNNADVLPKCLAALAHQTVAPAHVIVVDNASSDGCAAGLVDTQALTVLRPGANLGFAGGNNLAVRAADTEFVALLNPDAFAHPTWLEELLAAARRHPDAASIGSTQWIDSAEGLLDGCGDAYHASSIVYRAGYGRRGPPPPEAEAFSACAAAALYRRDAFLEIGGFDERYFCYCEDVDLGFRLRLRGYRCIQSDRAQVRHVGSSTTGRYSDFAIFHGVRNRVWTFVKNVPAPFHVLLAPYAVFGVAAHWAAMAARGCGGAYGRALKAALQELGPILQERRKVQAARTVPAFKILRAMRWSPLSLLRRS